MGDFTFKTECVDIAVPDCCVCCLGPAEETIEVAAVHQGVVVETTTTWSFPYCKRCAAHVKAHERAWMLAAVPGLLVTVIVLWLGGFPEMPGMQIFGTILLGGVVMCLVRIPIAKSGAQTGKGCAGEAALVGVTASVVTGGTFTFAFKNPEYGKRFAAANQESG